MGLTRRHDHKISKAVEKTPPHSYTGEFKRSLQRTDHDGRAHPNSEPLELAGGEFKRSLRTNAKKSVRELNSRSR